MAKERRQIGKGHRHKKNFWTFSLSKIIFKAREIVKEPAISHRMILPTYMITKVIERVEGITFDDFGYYHRISIIIELEKFLL